MTEEITPQTRKFYDAEYWKKGDGRLLWNMRKMLAFIMEVSNEDTPSPFLTSLHGDESGSAAKWEGWYASWNEGSRGEGSLALEWNGSDFFVYAFDKDTEYEFWYEFDAADDNSWVAFPEAVSKAKDWLGRNKDILPKTEYDSLTHVFNLN
jgi:hypothetical protein